MECNKEHFRHLLLYCFDLKKKWLPKLIDSSQKLILNLFYRLKHVRTGFVDSNDDFDLKDKECSGQPKKFKDAELQALLDEN